MAGEPTVCAILLTRDRPVMAKRAVQCFRAQTYEHAWLMVVDTGDKPFEMAEDKNTVYCPSPVRGKSIGYLRNMAIDCASEMAFRTGTPEIVEIIAHFDDDDWSHPNRLAEQVALLQSTGADLVGYNEALFWNTRKCQIEIHLDKPAPDGGTGCLGIVKSIGEAWRYCFPSPKFALGGSFCYWRRTWEAHPFDHVNQGEDERFRLKCKSVVGATSLPTCCYKHQKSGDDQGFCAGAPTFGTQPRLICQIHGANSTTYDPAEQKATFTRAAEWDDYCRGIMSMEAQCQSGS